MNLHQSNNILRNVQVKAPLPTVSIEGQRLMRLMMSAALLAATLAATASASVPTVENGAAKLAGPHTGTVILAREKGEAGRGRDNQHDRDDHRQGKDDGRRHARPPPPPHRPPRGGPPFARPR